jgi:hypothetical protein
MWDFSHGISTVITFSNETGGDVGSPLESMENPESFFRTKVSQAF